MKWVYRSCHIGLLTGDRKGCPGWEKKTVHAKRNSKRWIKSEESGDNYDLVDDNRPQNEGVE